MVHRSLLYCPGDDREMMAKAIETDADVVVFDLEDAVAPAAKAQAREAVVETLADLDEPSPAVWVRINPPDRNGADDVAALWDGDASNLDCVVLPKAEKPGTVATLRDRLRTAGVDHVGIVPLVETATGLLAVEEVSAAPGVVAVAYGDQDYTADVGATVTDDKTESLYARQRVVAAAGAAGVDALDTVYTDFEDADGLREQAATVVDFGFDGKLAIHPSQVEVINEAFTPDPDDVEWAETVIAKHERVGEEDRGAFTVDGQMIDPPLVERARTILERAEVAGIR